MSKTDSITLWKSRIQSRKLSGLKVNDWCEQNSISRDSYYYWYRKLKDIKVEQGNIFAEVLPAPAPMLPVEKVTRAEILIAWKYLLEEMPNNDHLQHPEVLDKYLPWSAELSDQCRLKTKHKKCLKR